MPRLRNRDGPDLLFMPSFRRAIFHCPRQMNSRCRGHPVYAMLFKMSSLSQEASLVGRQGRRQSVCTRVTGASERRKSLQCFVSSQSFMTDSKTTRDGLTVVDWTARLPQRLGSVFPRALSARSVILLSGRI
jgi:hypothetical protein